MRLAARIRAGGSAPAEAAPQTSNIAPQTVSNSRFIEIVIVTRFAEVVEKWEYRVRLNGADHQWGKDPPKEVVG